MGWGRLPFLFPVKVEEDSVRKEQEVGKGM